MTIDPAHQSTLVELAAIQREHEDLRRSEALLRKVAFKALGYVEACLIIERKQGRPVRIEEVLVAELREVLAGVLLEEEQDPAADAAEDEAFRVAEARMEAAEAREDAAARREKARA